MGNLTSVTDQNGNTTQYAYDQLNQLIQITDALANVTKFTYDQNGNRTSIIDAQNNTTTFAYNTYNQLVTIADVLNSQTSFTYDANGNTVTVKDAENNTTTNAYDALDRLIKVTDALNNATQYTYDQNGNLTSIKDAKGNTTTYTYDSLNRLTKTTYPNSSTETYAYDKVGNLISKTDQKGNTITYAYDNLNRLVTKTYPDTTQVTYAYDSLSRLTSTANANSTINYSYDGLNRIIQVTQDTKTVGYEYDGVGNRTKLTYPDGSYITYTYDALNRLDQIKNSTGQVIADYTYDDLSRRNQLDLKNGTQALYQYDQISRLTNLTNKIASTNAIISSFVYTYDRVGNRTSMTTLEGTHTYTYDKIYQLTSVNYPDGYPFPDITYNFDAVGNRTSTINGGTVNYTTNNLNQYTDVGGTAYTYDANGNLTSDGVNTYTYDYENRLIQVTTPTDTIVYTYDPLGGRISKTYSTGTTKYIYDDDQVIMETDDAGTIKATYAYGTGIDEVLTMTRGSSTYYYHLDGLGSVNKITNSTGSTVEKYKFNVYGQPSIFDVSDNQLTESAIGNSYMFTGREYNKESRLYYYRARYYSPEIGRFLIPDPIGYHDSSNRYSYVMNNSVNNVDPFGFRKQKPGERRPGEVYIGREYFFFPIPWFIDIHAPLYHQYIVLETSEGIYRVEFDRKDKTLKNTIRGEGRVKIQKLDQLPEKGLHKLKFRKVDPDKALEIARELQKNPPDYAVFESGIPISKLVDILTRQNAGNCQTVAGKILRDAPKVETNFKSSRGEIIRGNQGIFPKGIYKPLP